jgi:hypothetical protein
MDFVLKGLKKKIRGACSFKDYNSILLLIERNLNFASTTDFPIFTLAHPSYIEKQYMKVNHVSNLQLSEIDFRQLVDNGFSLLDRAVIDDMLDFFPDNPFELLFGSNEHILIDTSYGLLLGTINNKRSNLSLDNETIVDYLNAYPFLRNRSDYLSIGNVLAQTLKGLNFDPYKSFTYRVRSREELNEILSDWKEIISFYPSLSIWYRGQTTEYMLPDLTEQANKNLCPWRNIIDASLCPSIYRSNMPISTFTTKMLEMLKMQSEFTAHFSQYGRSEREISDICIEKIPEHLQGGEWTLTKTLLDGENRGGTTVIQDTHHHYIACIELLLQQHYGIDSPLLDVTKDIDTALFFAQNKMRDGQYVQIDTSVASPVIYVFILNQELDPIIDSEILMKEFSALRPVRQKCGVLLGATQIKKEFYSKFIAIKIYLDEHIVYDNKITADYLFPNQKDDAVLDILLNITERHKLEYVKPFQIIS